MTEYAAYLKHDDGKYYKHILIRSKDMEDFDKFEQVQVGSSIDTLRSCLTALDKEVHTLESTLSETSQKRTIVRTVLCDKLNHTLAEIGLTEVDFNISEEPPFVVDLPASEVEKTPAL